MSERQPYGQFAGPGTVLVRRFLILVLIGLGVLTGLAGWLSWYLGMELSVRGRGVVEPRCRQAVRVQISGVVHQIAVRQGQQVVEGEPLAALDDREWQTELRKAEKDLEINEGRREELKTQIQRDRELGRAEVARASQEVEEALVLLEQERVEQSLYSGELALPVGRQRRPLEELLPVRRLKALVEQRRAGMRLAQERLEAVEERQTEFASLRRAREKLEQDRQLLQGRLVQTVIRAPCRGMVLTGDLQERVGTLVQAGETLLELAGPEGWQARVVVQEMDLPKVAAGQPVRLYIHAFPHLEYKIFSGRVEEVGLAPGREEGAYVVEVAIADPEVVAGERTYSLACGMSAEVRIAVERGRIATLARRWLLRQLGKNGGHGLFAYQPGAGS